MTKPSVTTTVKRGSIPAEDRAWWQSPMTWILGLIILAGFAAVIAAASARDSSSDTPQTAFAEAIGTPLPPLSSPDAALGTTAPIISAETLAGSRVQVGDDGTARLYGFFAHWCPHCQDELPTTVSWLESNPLPEGVEIVAVSTGVDPAAPNYPPSEWFEDENWPATVLLDSEEQALATAFGLTAYPFWVAVDADGVVVARVEGSIPEADLASLVQQLTPIE